MGKWRNPKDPSLSGVDAQRAMLDELMGMNRNLDNPDAEVTDYKDKRTCTHFLISCCPHDVFSKTKMDLGPCEKVHKDELKEQFDERKTEEEEWMHLMDLERVLRPYINDVDKKIARGHRRLEGDQDPKEAGMGRSAGSSGGGDGKLSDVDINNNPEVLKLQAEIEDHMAQAEAKGEEGEVDEASELMSRVEELRRKKAEIQSRLVADAVAKGQMEAPHPVIVPVSQSGRLQDVNQKLRVCEACGAFLSISDNDKRLADHFGGKLHLGYVQMREKLQEINEIREKRRAARMAPPSDRGHAQENGDSGRGRDRSRDRGGRDNQRRDRSRDRRDDRRDDRYGRGGRHDDSRYRPRGRSRDRDRRSRSRDRLTRAQRTPPSPHMEVRRRY